MADDEKEILRILRAQEAAIGRGDAEAAISPLAADVVTYDLPPPNRARLILSHLGELMNRMWSVPFKAFTL